MRERFRQDPDIFKHAAAEVAKAAARPHDVSTLDLVSYLGGACWPDVKIGFQNEVLDWRTDADMRNIVRTGDILFSSGGDAAVYPDEDFAGMFEAMLYVLAFGKFGPDEIRIPDQIRLAENLAA